MRKIVSIFGGSGSGKSTLAKALAEALGVERASRVPTDYYLRSREVGMAEFVKRPLMYDWELLGRHLDLPVGSNMTTPDFDFVDFVRRSDGGGLAYVVREVMIVDAMLTYPEADIYIYVSVPDEVRRERIIERDGRWGTKVIELWNLHQATLEAIDWENQRVDLRLDGLTPVENNVGKVLEGLGVSD